MEGGEPEFVGEADIAVVDIVSCPAVLVVKGVAWVDVDVEQDEKYVSESRVESRDADGSELTETTTVVVTVASPWEVGLEGLGGVTAGGVGVSVGKVVSTCGRLNEPDKSRHVVKPRPSAPV